MDDQDFRDLQERTALIEEMTEHPGWTLLQDRARVSLAKAQQRIILGRAETMEDYRSQCGWMDGVSFVLALPAQVKAELERELEARAEEEPESEED